MFNATFNNISVISCRSVLLVEETGVSGENHWPVVSHWQTLSHNVVSYHIWSHISVLSVNCWHILQGFSRFCLLSYEEANFNQTNIFSFVYSYNQQIYQIWRPILSINIPLKSIMFNLFTIPICFSIGIIVTCYLS